jgi:CRISPR/Cas system CMR-associated protein Cmr3 (group 5 of RAMP superfamily)
VRENFEKKETNFETFKESKKICKCNLWILEKCLVKERKISVSLESDVDQGKKMK